MPFSDHRGPLAILHPMPRAVPPATPRLLIRSSAIHAAGVTTLDPIPRGRRILEYDGPRISKDVADDRYAEKPVTYLFSIDGSSDVIDGFSAAMFVNHSCAPNCETEEDHGASTSRPSATSPPAKSSSTST